MANKRHTYLINSPFQLKFAFFVSAVLVLSSLVYPWVIYGLFDSFGTLLEGLNLQLIEHQEELQARRNELLLLLVTFQACFAGLIFVISIFVSHRIAGPIFKAIRFVKNLRMGSSDRHLQFRKKDNFPELANELSLLASSINQENQKLGAMIQTHPDLVEAVEMLKEMQKNPDKLKDEKTPDELDGIIKKIEFAIDPKLDGGQTQGSISHEA